MIAGINTSGQLNALYPQYNVTPVHAMKKLESVDSEGLVPQEKNQEEEASSVSLSEELKNATQVAYSNNPYDQAKKMADSTLLVGQNLDYVA